MERSDKQRKPVAIKNLAELKRFIQPGVEFKTLSQKNHPDLVGLTRVVTTVQTVCFYSKIKDHPNSRISTDNGGKASGQTLPKPMPISSTGRRSG